MQGTIPTQALMPNVHQEVEKKCASFQDLGTWWKADTAI